MSKENILEKYFCLTYIHYILVSEGTCIQLFHKSEMITVRSLKNSCIDLKNMNLAINTHEINIFL